MEKLRHSVLFFLALSILSCQPKEKGPWIYGNLYVRYLQEGSQIKAEASFSKGDSIHLAKPISILGGVTFRGSGMEQRNIQGKLIRYKYEHTGDYPGQFTFQAQDEEGKSYAFAMDMAPVSDFSLPDTIYPSKGCVVTLSPAPDAAEEALAFLFTDSTGKAALIEVPAPLSVPVSLPANELAKLLPGLHQLYLVKKKHTSLTQARFQVEGDVEFYTKVKEVFVADSQSPQKEED